MHNPSATGIVRLALGFTLGVQGALEATDQDVRCQRLSQKSGRSPPQLLVDGLASDARSS
jgi:hypothetical protein